MKIFNGIFSNKYAISLLIILALHGLNVLGSEGNQEFKEIIEKTQQFKKQYLGRYKDVPGVNEPGRLLSKANLCNIAKLNKDGEQKVVDFCKGASWVATPDAVELAHDFFTMKRDDDSAPEQKLYKQMSFDDFCARLFEKRMLCCVGAGDPNHRPRSIGYVLRDGTAGNQRADSIKELKHKFDIILDEYLSTDEQNVASLFGIKSNTFFINSGYRSDKDSYPQDGTIDESRDYISEGLIVGGVGPCFEQPDLFAWQFMIITEEQNTKENGYGLGGCDQGLLSIWAKFFGQKFPTYEEASNDPERFITFMLGDKIIYFHRDVYKHFIKNLIKGYFITAISEGHSYIRIPGFGLGPWAVTKDFLRRQEHYFLEAIREILNETWFKENELDMTKISDIDFMWFRSCDGWEKDFPGKEIENMTPKAENKLNIVKGATRLTLENGHGINVLFSSNNLASKFYADSKGNMNQDEKSLATAYAWDHSTLIGNEYWIKHFNASGDPVAACASLIPFIQNPYINPYLLKNIKEQANIMLDQINQAKATREAAEEICKNDNLLKAVIDRAAKEKFDEYEKALGKREKILNKKERLLKTENESLQLLQNKLKKQEDELNEKAAKLEADKKESEENKENGLEKFKTEKKEFSVKSNAFEKKQDELEKSFIFKVYQNRRKAAVGMAAILGVPFIYYLFSCGFFEKLLNKTKFA